MGFNLDRALSAQAEAKALPAHPAFMDRTRPVSTYSPGSSRENAVISQREAMRHAEAYGGSQAIDWFYDCVGLYADAAATSPFQLTSEDGKRLVKRRTPGTPPDYDLGPKDLYALLENPNPFMLYSELLSLLVIDLLSVGNGYWLKWRPSDDGRPLALYRLSPAYVKIEPGKYGPKRYLYQPPGAREPMKIELGQMIHFRRANPHSPYYGMGVIQGAGRAMDLEIAVTDTMASYYENRADPSLVIESERRVPRDVFNKLRAQLRARVAGPGRAGEMLLLESGLKANPLSVSARDALFAELSTMSRDRIFTKFRASPLLFGLMDESAGPNKVSDVRREFDNYALRPLLKSLGTQITSALTSAWGVEFEISYQTMLPPDEMVKVAGEIAKAPGIKVRDVRKQYAQFGIEESTGDPEIDEFVLNMPTPEADASGMVTLPDGTRVRSDAVGADRPLPGEPGRPPKGENTRGFGSVNPEGKALSVDEVAARLEVLGTLEKIQGKALNAAGENVTVGNQLEGEQRPQDPTARARQIEIDAATTAIAAELRGAAHELERALLDAVEGKALKTSDIVKRIKSSDAWTTFKDRLNTILTDGTRSAVLSGIAHTGKLPDEELDVDAIVASIVNRPEGLRSIIKTLRDRVANKVKDARARDGERSDYEAAIRSAISDWTDAQVVTIADSESTEAYNEAVLTTLEAVGEEKVFVTDGHDHDPECEDADGQVWDIKYARAHRKEHPRCRRAFLSLAETLEPVS